MTIELDDLTGLNRTTVAGMPIVQTPLVAQGIVNGAAARSLAIAGMRHSQGGHTAVKNGRVLLTETLQEVRYNPADQTVTASGGATWSQIHQVLYPHGRAMRVHQSSAHFTVGGSLGVNCHGRDPSEAPLSGTVTRIKVLCGDGQPREATGSNEHQDLFRAVIGGYGCCGLILEATFSTTRNLGLREIWSKWASPAKYLSTTLARLPSRYGHDNLAHLHYGWFCCVPGNDFLKEVLSADYVEFFPDTSNFPREGEGPLNPGAPLKEEGWGTSEILRAGWVAGMVDPKFKQMFWDELKNPLSPMDNYVEGVGGTIGQKHLPDWRQNWMRASVSFTASHGGPGADGHDRVEILQEYFVPPEHFDEMIGAMRAALKPGNAAGIDLLTCTVRLVQPDDVTALSYARGGKRVCIALEATVRLDRASGIRAPTQATVLAFRGLIDKAISLHGSFYLPYYRFATPDQFKAGYPGGAEALLAAIQKYDPQRKFWNSFLQEYVG